MKIKTIMLILPVCIFTICAHAQCYVTDSVACAGTSSGVSSSCLYTGNTVTTNIITANLINFAGSATPGQVGSLSGETRVSVNCTKIVQNEDCTKPGTYYMVSSNTYSVSVLIPFGTSCN